MRKVALFSLAMVLGNLSATRADACRLWDWIRGQRSGQSAAASLLAPATGVGYSALRPYTVQRVLVGYAPRTTYQTTWVAAPVTYYRPLTTMDPTRSTLTTALQPCTGYQWRQQRVPVTSYRPIYSTVAVPTRAPTVPLVGQPSAAFPGLAPPLTRAPEGLQVTPYGPTYPTPALTAPAVTAPAIAPRAADTAPALDAGPLPKQRVQPEPADANRGARLEPPHNARIRPFGGRATDLRPIPNPSRQAAPEGTYLRPAWSSPPARRVTWIRAPNDRSVPIAWNRSVLANTSFQVPVGLPAPVVKRPRADVTGWHSAPSTARR